MIMIDNNISCSPHNLDQHFHSRYMWLFSCELNHLDRHDYEDTATHQPTTVGVTHANKFTLIHDQYPQM